MLNVCERQDSLRYAILSFSYLMLMTLIDKSYNLLIARVKYKLIRNKHLILLRWYKNNILIVA